MSGGSAIHSKDQDQRNIILIIFNYENADSLHNRKAKILSKEDTIRKYKMFYKQK